MGSGMKHSGVLSAITFFSIVSNPSHQLWYLGAVFGSFEAPAVGSLEPPPPATESFCCQVFWLLLASPILCFLGCCFFSVRGDISSSLLLLAFWDLFCDCGVISFSPLLLVVCDLFCPFGVGSSPSLLLSYCGLFCSCGDVSISMSSVSLLWDWLAERVRVEVMMLLAIICKFSESGRFFL